VRPTSGQVEDLIAEVKGRCARNERTLVTTLTKRLAEDLAEFLSEAGIRTTYLHSDIDAIERVDVLNSLRSGEIQCIVGVNLLREGLDLPEVSLVCIFDADKQGFLRSEGSLVQTIGRAARNLNGLVIFYADQVSAAMKAAMSETDRRRAHQVAYNEKHGITPRSAVRQDNTHAFDQQIAARRVAEAGGTPGAGAYTTDSVPELTQMMLKFAEDLHFEEAARIRDQIKRIESGQLVMVGETAPPRRMPKRGRGTRRR
jgi:excinuclease ABC subunit B